MVRCGMVYLEPEGLGLDPLVNCWLKRLPKVSALRISEQPIETYVRRN